MKNFKKTLMIDVEDSREDEEDIQMNQITSEIKNIRVLESPQLEVVNKSYEKDEKFKIFELNNPFMNQLLLYMENENSSQDFSYQWLNRIHNLGLLAKSLYVTQKNMDKMFSDRQCNEEFNLIKLMTEDKKHKENLIKLPRNLLRNNRYTDILPYQINTVFIGEENSQFEANIDETYVNASYIDGPLMEDNKFFIATQGPLNNTISKFWKLIFTRNVRLIVMLCNLEEDTRKKCECYWPKQGTIKQTDDIEIYLENEEYVINKCLIRREFILRFYGLEKRVTQLQMINWPDHSSPEEDYGYSSIYYILCSISEFRANYSQSPILTHCSAGTGRTGTLIAIHNIIRSFNVVKIINQNIELKHYKIKPFFSVFNIVRKLREQRMGMVSSINQYKYIYEFISEWLKRNFD